MDNNQKRINDLSAEIERLTGIIAMQDADSAKIRAELDTVRSRFGSYDCRAREHGDLCGGCTECLLKQAQRSLENIANERDTLRAELEQAQRTNTLTLHIEPTNAGEYTSLATRFGVSVDRRGAVGNGRLSEYVFSGLPDVMYLFVSEAETTRIKAQLEQAQKERNAALNELGEYVTGEGERDEIHQQLTTAQQEAARLREDTEMVSEILYCAPELNISNYTEDQVTHLNTAVIEAFEILRPYHEAAKARIAALSPQPEQPAQQNGGSL